MERDSNQEQIRKQFVSICTELLWLFPELELQFCHPGNSATFRCLFNDINQPPLELPLELENSVEIVREASFRIKELYALYDA